MASQPKKTLKIVILGDSGVGKTSLMNRYSTGKFTGQYKATIGADFVTKEMVVTDAFGQRHFITLQIWDTAGQERFQSLGVGFYRGSDCAMLCYDITDPHSLDNLDHWRKEFLQQVGGPAAMMAAPGLADSSAQFPFVVVGNKIDKSADRMVPPQRAEEWCRTAAGDTMTGAGTGMMSHVPPFPHYETSAKTSVNVEEAFHEVARLALQYEDYKKRSQPQLFVPPPTQPIDLRQQQQQQYNDNYGRRRNDGCC